MIPRVSVVVPCYNLGEFLDEAVASVLAQTHQDFEIIVVDDGSTDADTCRRLADFERPSTRVIRAPHEGLAAARNRGAAVASGDYLCFLDADDRLRPRFLEQTVGALDRDPGVAFASTWLQAFGDETWQWTPRQCDLAVLLCEDSVLTAALVRRHAFAAVGGFDGGMPVQGDEDWDFWLTLVERGYPGVIVPEILFDYRRRAGSMSTICWHGPGHVPLAEYRIAKHADAYRSHLVEVLIHQDGETADLLRHNSELERYIATELEPFVEAQTEDLSGLQSRLASVAEETLAAAAPGRRIAELENALAASVAEVAALRASKSWQVTGPLRTVYGWWLRSRDAK